MTTIEARPGETIDQACQRAYGRTSGAVEAVLAGNPWLSALPKRLPLGTVILLPALAASADADPVVKLWD